MSIPPATSPGAAAAPGGATHVMVVDDDARLRDLLRRYLTEQGFVITTAADAAEARARLEVLAVDLIVLDVMMPGQTGLDFTRELRRTSGVPILLLTAMGDVDDRILGLESGADDYLPKPFEPRELVLRIRTILKRVPPPTARPSLVRMGEVTFDPVRQQLMRGDEPVRLTQAEMQLLALFASRPGQPVGREDVVEAGLSASAGRALDVQVTRLRRKIEPDLKFPRYLQTVRGKGYMLQPD